MDRLAAYWDQAVIVACHAEIDFEDLLDYAKEEYAGPDDIGKLRLQTQQW